MPGERFVPAIGRSIATQEKYVAHLAEKRRTGDTSCDLSNNIERQRQYGIYPMIGERAIILTNEFFTVIDNDFPYSVYDGQQIIVHHMLVPYQHIDYDSLIGERQLRHEFVDAEAELMEVSGGAYTANLARSSGSVASSIRSHAHKHFFVTGAPVIEQHFSVAEARNDVTFSIRH